jgi:hypothetical protein
VRTLPVLVAMIAGSLAAPPAGGTGPVEVLTARMFLEGGGETAELEWPVLAGGTGDEAVIAINEALSYESVAGEPFEQTMQTYTEIQRGIVGSGFEMNFNDLGILDLTIQVEFLGAYPSTSEYYFTFDTGTGRRLAMADLMSDERLPELAALVNERLQENIRTAESVYCPGPNGVDLESFSVEEGGIEFHYDFGFPHIILAAEPEEDVFLSFDELAPCIDPEGPLGGME